MYEMFKWANGKQNRLFSKGYKDSGSLDLMTYLGR